MDIHDAATRSYNMSRIRNTGTKLEDLVCKNLFRMGYRYRRNVSGLPGKPDIVLPKYMATVFINGCFWHGHQGCKRFTIPKTNTAFWKKKIENNILRDKNQHDLLKQIGWRVITVWECELVKDRVDKTIEKLVSMIISD